MLLQASNCRQRQVRLIEWMIQQKIDVSLVTYPPHVYYLTGALQIRDWPMAAIVWSHGDTILIDHTERQYASADRLVRYQPQILCTIKPELEAMVATYISQELSGKRPAKAAIEYACCYPYVTQRLCCPTVPLDAQLREMRRRKDADEVVVLKRLIEIGNHGYAVAKSLMIPGKDELEIYEAIHASMVQEAGAEIEDVGWDFACGQIGGPPRKGRTIAAGELYIFDMGPHQWGYYADSCRTFSVGGPPSSEQRNAWEFVVEALNVVARMVKPGTRTLDVWAAVKKHLDSYQPGAFSHHLGHGVGLAVHESPRLNPNFDDTFQEGDVFAAEPGLYAPALRGGLRLEHIFRVTSNGVEILTDFPLEMA
ncbi:MAG: aminopeptidase P family protein [Verrucomicrobiae bacterium]|nr:aminopeptidase P family protein [Verrucomicrobiae bacterium]